MPITVTIKWLKEIWKDVEVDTAAGLQEFQATVFSLSKVPPERQKLISKGKLIKDDASVQALKKGAKVMLTGTADEVPTGPSKAVVFIEDMPEAQQQALQGHKSAGLNNLGNTCYMNSTLQCFRHIPELRVALNRFTGAADMEQQFLSSLGKLFRDLDDSAEPVTPDMFVMYLRKLFAQFAEVDEKGRYKQQDADECLSSILATASRHLKSVDRDNKLSDQGENAVDYLFGGEFQARRTCDESEAEPVREEVELFRKVKCYIDNETNFLYQGINKSLEEKMEMRAETLGRTAVFTRKLRISRLPRILCIHFMRFRWGSQRKDGFATKEAHALKVMRKCEYPMKLDMSEYCSDSLKESLSYARQVLKIEKDKELGLAVTQAEPTEKKAKKKKVTKKKDEEAAKILGPTIKSAKPISTSGHYEIFGVVTHKGRAADGGHYIGWVKDKDGTWWRYDDEKVSSVTEEQIKNLCGGGDHDMAYIAMYRRLDDLKDRPLEWWTAAPAEASTTDGSPST
eukprot:gb/GEZN01005875.1/.p1 GENE.gb/GEZN01005875.1/~~gb/GEZN01005875.1/.p1  ORF type:complete len:512 (-),score=101.87 gb/GEZN01005875.1/:175-1710(-)